MKLRTKDKNGFTLVELLVVIAIIGIIAIVAVPSLMKNINKAKAADLTSHISAINTLSNIKYSESTTSKELIRISNEEIKKEIEDIPKEVINSEVWNMYDNGIMDIYVDVDFIKERPLEEEVLENEIIKYIIPTFKNSKNIIYINGIEIN